MTNSSPAKRFALFVLLLLSLSLTSCAGVARVQSKFPLSDPDEAQPDARLYGKWTSCEKESRGSGRTLAITRPAENQIANLPPGIAVVTVTHCLCHRDHQPQHTWCFFVTGRGRARYVNSIDMRLLHPRRVPKWDKARIHAVDILKYSIEDDRLIIWPMAAQPAADAVDNNEVKGVVTRGENRSLSSVLLTDTPENIAQFLKARDAALFPDAGKEVYRRVTDSQTPASPSPKPLLRTTESLVGAKLPVQPEPLVGAKPPAETESTTVERSSRLNEVPVIAKPPLPPQPSPHIPPANHEASPPAAAEDSKPVGTTRSGKLLFFGALGIGLFAVIGTAVLVHGKRQRNLIQGIAQDHREDSAPVRPGQFVRFLCPGCQKRLKAPARAAGKSGSCPKCSTRVTLPSLSTTLR